MTDINAITPTIVDTTIAVVLSARHIINFYQHHYYSNNKILVQSSTAAAICLSSFSEAASTLGLLTSPWTVIWWNVWRVLCNWVVSSPQKVSAYQTSKAVLSLPVMAALTKIRRDRRLSLTTRIRTYKALFLCTLLHAAET